MFIGYRGYLYTKKEPAILAGSLLGYGWESKPRHLRDSCATTVDGGASIPARCERTLIDEDFTKVQIKGAVEDC